MTAVDTSIDVAEMAVTGNLDGRRVLGAAAGNLSSNIAGSRLGRGVGGRAVATVVGEVVEAGVAGEVNIHRSVGNVAGGFIVPGDSKGAPYVVWGFGLVLGYGLTTPPGWPQSRSQQAWFGQHNPSVFPPRPVTNGPAY
jgi:hypothetical protein